MSKLEIGLSNSDTFESMRRAGNGRLVSDPAEYIAKFFMHSMHKYSVIRNVANKDRLMDYDHKKEIYKERFKEDFREDFNEDLKESMIKTITKPRLNNVNRLFEAAVKDLKKGNNVYATPKGGVLFINWAIENNINIEELNVDTLLSLDELADINNEIKNEAFYPIALERLFKLFMLFYSKHLEKEEIRKVGGFQNQLSYIERQTDPKGIEYAFKCIETKKIDFLLNLLNRTEEKVSNQSDFQLPSVNLFNKINEELNLLDNKLHSENNRFSCENSIKITSVDDLSDNFIDKYIRAVA